MFYFKIRKHEELSGLDSGVIGEKEPLLRGPQTFVYVLGTMQWGIFESPWLSRS